MMTRIWGMAALIAAQAGCTGGGGEVSAGALDASASDGGATPVADAGGDGGAAADGGRGLGDGGLGDGGPGTADGSRADVPSDTVADVDSGDAGAPPTDAVGPAADAGGGGDGGDGAATTADASPTDADVGVALDGGPGGDADATVPDVGGDSDVSAGVTCLPEPVRTELSEHMTSLLGFIQLVDGHASESEAVGFLTLPHWDAAAPSFAFLFMPCAGPTLYDPWCDGLVCSQIECNEQPPTWTEHTRPFQSPLAHGGFTYTDCANHVRWLGVGDSLEVREACEAVDGNGLDYTVEGEALLEGPLITAEQAYTHLVKGQVVVLSAEADLTTMKASGALHVGGALTALLVQGPAGVLSLHPTGTCAE